MRNVTFCYKLCEINFITEIPAGASFVNPLQTGLPSHEYISEMLFFQGAAQRATLRILSAAMHFLLPAFDRINFTGYQVLRIVGAL